MTTDAAGLRIVRHARPGGHATHGALSADGHTVHALSGDIFGHHALASDMTALADTVLLAPVQPGKVVGIGLNHAATVEELGDPATDGPLLFLKGPNTVIGPNAAIVCPPGVAELDVAGEVAVVIGRRARHLSERDALEHVLGYTCAIDVAVRDWLTHDRQWFRAKSCDTFCPLGPWVAPLVDPGDLGIAVAVNGDVRQSGTMASLIWDVPRVLAHITRYAALEPGDVVLTGSPGGLATAAPGDVVEVTIDRIGTLVNTVVAAHDVGKAG